MKNNDFFVRKLSLNLFCIKQWKMQNEVKKKSYDSISFQWFVFLLIFLFLFFLYLYTNYLKIYIFCYKYQTVNVCCVKEKKKEEEKKRQRYSNANTSQRVRTSQTIFFSFGLLFFYANPRARVSMMLKIRII